LKPIYKYDHWVRRGLEHLGYEAKCPISLTMYRSFSCEQPQEVCRSFRLKGGSGKKTMKLMENIAEIMGEYREARKSSAADLWYHRYQISEIQKSIHKRYPHVGIRLFKNEPPEPRDGRGPHTYGDDQFMSGWDHSSAYIGFKMSGRMIKFVLPLPARDDPEFQTTPAGRSECDRISWIILGHRNLVKFLLLV
jgi:hypothetical protein